MLASSGDAKQVRCNSSDLHSLSARPWAHKCITDPTHLQYAHHPRSAPRALLRRRIGNALAELRSYAYKRTLEAERSSKGSGCPIVAAQPCTSNAVTNRVAKQMQNGVRQSLLWNDDSEKKCGTHVAPRRPVFKQLHRSTLLALLPGSANWGSAKCESRRTAMLHTIRGRSSKALFVFVVFSPLHIQAHDFLGGYIGVASQRQCNWLCTSSRSKHITQSVKP